MERSFVPVPFDPKAVFGRVRAAVKVSLNGHIPQHDCIVGGMTCMPLRKSNREAAGLVGGEVLPVTIEPDSQQRKLVTPADLAQVLEQSVALQVAGDALSYTFRREFVEAIESAKKPETRPLRLAKIIESSKPPPKK